MNVVDSSGWIEYLAGGANADWFRVETRLPQADGLEGVRYRAKR